MNLVVKAIALTSVLFGSTIAVLPTSNAQAHNHEGQKLIASKGSTIVDAAKATPSLSTLVKVVVATNLAGTLSSKGPFTVFAPDNNAFANSPKPGNNTQLKNILTYHVVPGRLTSNKLHNGQMLKTVNGQKLKVIKFRNGTIKIKSSSGNIVTVKAANINNSNGVVHVINRVLIPAKF